MGKRRRAPRMCCPVVNCRQRIPRDELVCSDHWLRMPDETRREINRAKQRLEALESRAIHALNVAVIAADHVSIRGGNDA